MARVIEADPSWAGIAAALADARPGDTVRIPPGRHAGAETLSVPSGVTLEGPREAVLVFTGPEVAVAVLDAQDVTLRGFSVEGYAGAADDGFSEMPGAVPLGLVRIQNCARLIVDAIAVTALAARRSCIAATTSQAIEIRNCITVGGNLGISLRGTKGAIEACQVSKARFNGIELRRMGAEIGSDATVDDCECVENGHGGIVLLSSSSRSIRRNRCARNGINGISVERSQQRPDTPSSAWIEANVCSDNKQTGIGLFSSRSEAITGNQCSGNGASGIVLQRDSKSPDAPSSARIEANVCGDNKEAGIVLSSSQSEAITDNQCSGNGASGIVLLRDPRSPDAPSSARIEANASWRNSWAGIGVGATAEGPCDAFVVNNRLQDNGAGSDGPGYGIEINRAIGTFKDNRLKGNRHNKPPAPADGLVYERNHHDPTLDLPREVDDGLTGQIRGDLGPLADDRPEIPGAAAQFVTLGLTAAFQRLVEAVRGEEPADPPFAEVPEGAPWQVRWKAGARRIRPARRNGGPQALAGELQAMAMRAADAYEASVGWAGFVAPDGGSTDRLMAAFDAAREARNASVEDGAPGRIAPTLVALYPPAPADGTEPAGPDPLEIAALGTAGKWGQRFGCWLRSGLFWLVLVCLVASVALPVASVLGIEPLASWKTAFLGSEPLLPQTPVGWIVAAFGFLTATLVGGAVLLGLLNRLLPDSLELRLRRLTDAADKLTASGAESRKDPSVLLPARWTEAIKRTATVNWLRRRLFAQGQIAPVILRHIDGFSAEQLRRLKALASAVGGGQGLLVVIQLDDRAALRRSILDVPDAERPWHEAIDLHFDDGPETVALAAPPPAHAVPFEQLAGGIVEAPAVRAAVLNRDWTSLELPLVLPLGSAPTARFSIRRPATLTAEHDQALLRDIAVLSGFFMADRGVVPAAQTLQRVFDMAARSAGIGLTAGAADLRLWGKTGLRRDAAQAVRQVMADGGRSEADIASYLAASMACGLWRLLGDVTQALGALPQAKDTAETGRLSHLILLGLDGCRFLLAEMAVQLARGGEIDSAALGPRWQGLLAMLEAPLPDGVDAGAVGLRCVAAWGARQDAGLAQEAGNPWDSDAIFADLDAALETGSLASSMPSGNRARPALIRHLAGYLQLLRQMDSDLAAATIQRLRQQAWRGLPQTLLDGLAVRATGTARRTLVELLAAAPDLAALETVVRLHARQPRQVLHAIALLASQAAWPWPVRRWNPHTVDPPVDALAAIVALVRTVAGNRTLELEPDPHQPGWTPPEEARGIARSLQAFRRHLFASPPAAGVTALMAAADPAALVLAWLSVEPEEPALEAVIDLELDRLLALAPSA